MRTRLLITMALTISLLAAAPADAETRPPDGDAYIDDVGDPTVEVIDEVDGESATPGAPDNARCTWRVLIADDAVLKVYDANGNTEHSSTGRWMQKVCGDIGAVAVGGRFLVPEGGLVDVEALAHRALASVAINAPTIRTSPEVNGRLYVQIPTWLWIEGGWWQSYDATASAGRVTATVTARPTGTTWKLGDGTELECSGPGRAWEPSLSEGGTDCTHMYITSSAGRPSGTFDLEATVRLEVTWVSNVGHDSTLPAISRSATRTVDVGEIQAIGTGN